MDMDSLGHTPRQLSQKHVFRYAVTFEFDTRPPLTARGIVAGSTWRSLLSRAVGEAQKALRPINPSSICATLLERVPSGTTEAAEGNLNRE